MKPWLKAFVALSQQLVSVMLAKSANEQVESG